MTFIVKDGDIMTFWDFLCTVLMVVFGAALFILFLPIILIVLLVCIIFS